MVAVPHSKEHLSVPAQKSQILCQTFHSFRIDPPSIDAAAALHQRKAIEFFHLLPARCQARKQRPRAIIHQNHGMRQLQRCAAANLHPGRDALQHRALRGPDQCAASRVIIIFFQIDPAYQPVAHTAADRALHINHGIQTGIKQILFQIALHRGMNPFRAGSFIIAM